jgi:hypothetical protein
MQTEADLRVSEFDALSQRLDAITGRAPKPTPAADPLEELRSGIESLETTKREIADLDARKDSLDEYGIMRLLGLRSMFTGQQRGVENLMCRVDRSILNEQERQQVHAMLAGIR